MNYKLDSLTASAALGIMRLNKDWGALKTGPYHLINREIEELRMICQAK
jgi:hypothetical protein